MSFFDQYDRFYSTTRTGSHPNRMNSRYSAIIEPNLDLIRDRTVLDIASHDGRWTFAALMAGARHAIGIEGRAHLVDAARQSMAHYGIGSDRYKFYVGDICDVLETERIKVDTVLCLGFFYHTHRHFEIASLLAATGASHIVLDTALAIGPQPGKAFIEYALEPTDKDGAPLGPRDREIVGRPSRKALEWMFAQHGFELSDNDSSVGVDDPLGIEDYKNGRRAIFRLTRATPAHNGQYSTAMPSVEMSR